MTPNPACTTPQDATQQATRWLATQAKGWASGEGERWIFVAKTLLAAFTALWLAFRLGLDSPNTAMTTTFILALPSSGMVLEKSFYRLLGTLVGCASALLLTALFPQQAPLLFLGLALWLGACTCGAAMYRNQQSYSFVLAGYTAAMIAIPALDHPAGVFALAVTRVVEVSLGVMCATVVHEALFPRHHGAHVMRSVQARYESFAGFCRQVLEHRSAPEETELAHLRFAADIAALESGRAAAFFEAAHRRAHSRHLHAFNSAFMAALTTLYTLHRLIHRLRRDPASPVPALIEPLLAAQAVALAHGGAAATLPGAGTGADGAPATPERIDFETAVELLDRFARQFAEFAAIYSGLARSSGALAGTPQAYAPMTPPRIALAAGARAAAALLTVAGAWYFLAWPYAVNAVLMTAIFCALASSSPRPSAMIKQIMTGFMVAWPLSFVIEFFLVMPAGGYPMLVLAAAPLFAAGAYLSTDPKRAAVGIGMSMFSAQVIAPLNLMHYDVAAYFNSTLALVLGVLLAWAIYAVVLPGHTMGNKDHVAAALWREARATCTAPPQGMRHRFDNRVRDLLNQLNAASGPMPGEPARAVVRQGLTLLELGHSVLDLRGLIAVAGRSAARAALQECVRALAAYFDAPAQDTLATAIGAVLRAGAAVRAALPCAASANTAPHAERAAHLRTARLRTALTDLHSIYTCLLDQLPQARTGEPHAA